MKADVAPRPAGFFLAVEDDLVVQRAIARAVAGEFEVSFVDNGEAALKELAEGRTLPVFVLLDFMLPGLDGVQVLERLRADPKTKFLPVVLFSSVRDARHVRAALAAGANSWVVKRDDPQGFLDCVQAVCRYWMHLDVSS